MSFTPEERAAMKARARELKQQQAGADAAAEVVAKLAELPDEDRVLGEKVHEIVTTHAPGLAPKLWYGMPAYARDGKILCFFQGASKFKARYATLGFNDPADLDDGGMWPTAFALTGIGPDEEARIIDLVKRAAG